MMLAIIHYVALEAFNSNDIVYERSGNPFAAIKSKNGDKGFPCLNPLNT